MNNKPKPFSIIGLHFTAGLLIAMFSATSLASCGPKPVEPSPNPSTPSVTPIVTALTPAKVVSTTITVWPRATIRTSVSAEWQERVARILWVAYSPPTADPNNGIEASPKAIREDLAVLRNAGFTGLVTYSSSGVLGRELPALADSLGFQGLIMGIWDPSNQEEIAAAKAAADLPIVLGFCIGNEGLHKRYEMAVLSKAAQSLRQATGKPVTTTEETDDYYDKDLLLFGDWIFPNAHPYFHGQLDPFAAVRWTQAAFDGLRRRTDRFVMFKEVGLPTAGDPAGRLSEADQEKYYLELAKTDVQFVYFEAFDQPWKTHLPVEPHWGIFRSDRTPKLLGLRLMGLEPTLSLTPFPAPAVFPATVH